jgi:flagellar biosynthetic protein FlhB
MTPQELREELKNLEGDPQLKARRKQRQRDLAVERPTSLPPPAETPADGLKK